MTRGQSVRPLLSATLAILCCMPIACSRSETEVYPVRGEVFLNRKPAAGAAVHFHLVDEDACSPAFAIVDETGAFELSTYGTNDGAEPGEYIVTLNWRDEEKVDGDTINGPDRFGERYSKPKVSKLRATVAPGENVVPRFDLKE